MTVSLYGLNEKSLNDPRISSGEKEFYNYLLYRGINAPNGTEIIYNLTSPLVTPDPHTILLLHLTIAANLAKAILLLMISREKEIMEALDMVLLKILLEENSQERWNLII